MSSSKPSVIKALAGTALCLCPVPATANPACGLSLQGCVLPVQDAVVPVTEAPVVGPIEVAEPKGFPFVALLGLAAAAVAAYFLFRDDGSNAEPASP